MTNFFQENRLTHFAVGSRARRAQAEANQKINENVRRAEAAKGLSQAKTNTASRTSGNRMNLVTDLTGGSKDYQVGYRDTMGGTVRYNPMGTSQSYRFKPLEIDEEMFDPTPEAVKNIQSTRPDLFLTDTQLRNKVLPGIMSMFNVTPDVYASNDPSSVQGRIKVNKELAWQMRGQKRQMQQQRDELIAREVDRLQRKALAEYTREINTKNTQRVAEKKEAEQGLIAQRAAARQAAAKEAGRAIKETIDVQPTIRGGTLTELRGTSQAGGSFTPEQRAAAGTQQFRTQPTNTESSAGTGGTKKSTVAKEMIANSPELQREFLEYQDFLAEYESLSEEERGKVLSELEQEAKDLVDPYYNKQQGFIDRGVALGEQSLEDRKTQTIEDAQRGFTRGRADLRQATGEGMQSSIYALNRRGVMDSGINRLVADRFIDSLDKGTRRMSEDLVTSSSRAENAYQLGTGNLRLEQDIAEDKLDRARQFEYQTELGDIYNELEMQNFLNKGEAATEMFQQAPVDPEVAPTGRVTSTNNPGTTMADRVELRKQERLLKNRQQQQQLPTPVRQPTTYSAPRTYTPPTRTPTTSRSTGSISAKSAPGTTMAQRAAMRGALRSRR